MTDLRDVKKGDRFLEHDWGVDAVFVALEDAHEVNDPKRQGHECRAQLVKGTAGTADENGVVMFFEAHDPCGFGLRLYSMKQDMDGPNADD